MEISFFKAPVTNVTPLCSVSVEQIFSYIISPCARMATIDIRGAQPKERGVIKKTRLDFVTPCGVFSRRTLKNLLSVSGLLVLDIDHVNNATDLLVDACYFLTPELAFVSPSGDGVKFFIDVRKQYQERGWDRFDFPIVTDEERNRVSAIYKEIYASVSRIWEETYPGVPVDQSGSDLSRACFLPHNALAYIAHSRIKTLVRNGAK